MNIGFLDERNWLRKDRDYSTKIYIVSVFYGDMFEKVDSNATQAILKLWCNIIKKSENGFSGFKHR